jgi:hypothetical protein
MHRTRSRSLMREFIARLDVVQWANCALLHLPENEAVEGIELLLADGKARIVKTDNADGTTTYRLELVDNTRF